MMRRIVICIAHEISVCHEIIRPRAGGSRDAEEGSCCPQHMSRSESGRERHVIRSLVSIVRETKQSIEGIESDAVEGMIIDLCVCGDLPEGCSEICRGILNQAVSLGCAGIVKQCLNHQEYDTLCLCDPQSLRIVCECSRSCRCPHQYLVFECLECSAGPCIPIVDRDKSGYIRCFCCPL